MAFDPVACWDCPIHVRTLVAILVGTLLAILAGAALLAQSNLALRVLGATLLAISSLWAASFALVAPRWGIDWHSNFQAGNPIVNRLIVWSWFVIAFALGAAGIRRARQRLRPNMRVTRTRRSLGGSGRGKN